MNGYGRCCFLALKLCVLPQQLNCSVSVCCVNISECVYSRRCCWLCPQLPGRTISRCCRSPCWCWSSCWWTWRWIGQMWRYELWGVFWLDRRLALVQKTSISFWQTTPARHSTSHVPQERDLDLVSAVSVNTEYQKLSGTKSWHRMTFSLVNSLFDQIISEHLYKHTVLV